MLRRLLVAGAVLAALLLALGPDLGPSGFFWRLGGWDVTDAAGPWGLARSLAAGEGWVPWPGGVPREGSPSPLWVLCLTLPTLLGAPPSISGFLLGHLALAAAVLGAWRLAEAALPEDRRAWAPAAGWLVALPPTAGFWTAAGTDEPLGLALTAWLGVGLLRAPGARTTVLLGLLWATWRTEAALVLPLVALWAGRQSDGRRWLLGAVLPLLGLLALRVAVFGVPVPAPVLLGWGWLRGLRGGGWVRFALLRPTALGLLTISGLALGGLLATPRERRAPLLLTAGPTLLVLLLDRADVSRGGRVLTAALPALAVLAATGLAALAQRPSRLARAAAAGLVGLVLVETLLLAWPPLRKKAASPLWTHGARAAHVEEVLAAVEAPPEARVADVDAHGWLARGGRTVIDLSGLWTPLGDGDWPLDLPPRDRWVLWLQRTQPAVVHVSGGWTSLTGLPSDPGFLSSYVPLAPFEVGRAPQDGLWLRRDLAEHPGAATYLRR